MDAGRRLTTTWVSHLMPEVDREQGAPAAFDGRLPRTGWRTLAWLVITAMGAVSAWASQHAMNPDGIAYLDLADAFVRADWSAALNRLWSPLYPFLLAVTLRVVSPGPYAEFATVQLLNFAIFLVALASFEFFLSQLMCYRRTCAAKAASEGRVALPEWSLRLVGYAVFAYSSLELIPIFAIGPDMCVAAFVYVASGLLLKIRLRPQGTASFLLFGVVLGLGYLAKAPMFPLAFVFLALGAAAMYSLVPFYGILRRLLAALIPFALITGALVTAFFLAGKGVTWGESAKLNYAWMVNGLPYVHWQGEVFDSGSPDHPTRKIFPSPPVYEFATPVSGTYPPWDDPAYWYEGVTVHVDARSHLHNLVRSARVLLSMLLRMSVLAVGSLLLLYLGRRGRLFLRNVLPYSILLVPGLAAVGMFSLMWLETRFIGSFVTLFWLSLFASMTFVESHDASRAVKGVTVTMAAVLALLTCFTSYTRVQGAQPAWDLQRTVAQGLHRLDVRPGDTVAVILDPPGAFGAYWARLARVRIIAEIPACPYYAGSRCAEGQPDAVSAFLEADQKTREQILKSFEQTGANAVVMRNADHAPLPGWRRIPDTDYDVYLLRMGRESGS